MYASQKEFGQDEDAPLLPPLTADVMEGMDSYGPAKVACEAAVTAGFGPARRAIVRSGLIGGPGDPSGRSGYWPQRFAHADGAEGRVLVPDAPDQPTQLIDVRDLARWLVQVAEERTAGVFNAVGETVPLQQHLALAAAAGGGAAGAAEPDASFPGAGPSVLPRSAVPAPGGWLLGQGVREWSGPRSLPLWLADPDWHGMNARSNARATAAGLRLRPLQQTLTDTLAWEEAAGVERSRGAGLTREEECALLARLDGADVFLPGPV
ncbi:epimerase [Arthrobacter yangruifuii]|uniref:epimerase n=1 Tax=Arthrobacter yangruifuii TaxID=2606616 RepID=UPI001FEFF360|nr:epimerase [Arthrobacter yangruifuii]